MGRTLAVCLSMLPVAAVVLAACEKPVTTLKSEGEAPPAVVLPRALVATLPALQLVKTADAAAVSAGSPIGFTLAVSNAGPGTAQNVSLSDPLPAGTGLSWVVSPAVSGCSIGARVLSCRFGDVAAGAGVRVHVTSPTTVRSCALYSNTGTARADGVGEIQASATTTVRCPGLHVVTAAGPNPVNAGSFINIGITVTNAGPGAATGVTLNDALPTGPGMSWSMSPAVSGCSISSNHLTCSLGDMPAGTRVSVLVTSPTTTASCGGYTNGASATSANGASALSDGASTRVVCPIGLTATKTADADSVTAGSDIGFTITLTVGGPVTATGVMLHDGALPTGPGMSWSVSPAVAGCGISIGLQCSLGDLVAGTSVRVHVTSPTTAASCGVYTNFAEASSTNGAGSIFTNRASEKVICP